MREKVSCVGEEGRNRRVAPRVKLLVVIDIVVGVPIPPKWCKFWFVPHVRGGTRNPCGFYFEEEGG